LAVSTVALDFKYYGLVLLNSVAKINSKNIYSF